MGGEGGWFSKARVQRAGAAVASAVAVAAWCAGQASAASFAIVGGTPTFTAGAGEANAVTISGDPMGVVLRDTGAPLTAGVGCSALDATTVFCPAGVDAQVAVSLGDFDDSFARPTGGPSLPPSVHLEVEAGDGDDAVDLTGISQSATVNGGAGTDDIVGSDGGDALNGGPGDDEIDSGAGAPVFPEDALNGGDGNDVLVLRPLRGSVHGGTGYDTIDYSHYPGPLVITLGGLSGPPGSEFLFLDGDLEAVRGGQGDDEITGTADSNDLRGAAGDDVIDGAGGSDLLFGGDGEDVTDGGAGDDQLFVDDGLRDEVYCGPDDDVVLGDALDAVGGDCEDVDVGAVSPPPNDDFTQAVALDGTPPVTGTNVHAGHEAGEPDHLGSGTGASIWYRWTATASGTAFVSTEGSNFDSVVAVYTGGTVSSLLLAAGNDDVRLGQSWSRACFPAVAGSTYAIAVDGYAAGLGYPGGLGAAQLTWGEWTSNEPCATLPPTIAGTAQVGSTLSASTGTWAGAPSGFAYQWLACPGVGCFSIPGETGSTFTPIEEDIDSPIAVRVTALHPSDPSLNAIAYSAPTAPVQPAPPPPPPPPGGGGSGPTDLAVTGSVSPAQAAVGASHVWRFQVTNKGSGIAFGVRLDLELSANVAYGFGQVTRGSGCAPTAERRIRCTLDLLGPAGSSSATADVVVGTNVVAAGQVSVSATASYADPDPTPADNAVTLTANVSTPPPPPPPPVAPKGVTRTGTPRADVLRGTPYADVLRGRGGGDRLLGLGGNDWLLGGPGADMLFGGTGRDTLDGGAGNDRLYTRDGAVDTLRCGLGRDRAEADRRDRVARDCEVVLRR